MDTNNFLKKVSIDNRVLVIVLFIWCIVGIAITLLFGWQILHIQGQVNELEMEIEEEETDAYVEPTESIIFESPIDKYINEPRFLLERMSMRETESIEETLYFDVPLDKDLQDHIFTTCEELGVDPALVVSIIKKESNYILDAVGDKGRSLGLMQIQPRWQKERMARFGCDDLLDPYQNITIGVDILRELIDTGNSLEWVLMAYNGGQAYANKYISQGIVSSYAKTVIDNSNSLVRCVTYLTYIYT